MEIRIDGDEVLKLASSLVKIPSENPLGNEREIADFLETKMREIGFKVSRYDFRSGRPNIIGELGSGRKARLIYDGHLDAVPAGNPDLWIEGDPFSGKIIDGKLYGKSSADMKASLPPSFQQLRPSRMRLKVRYLSFWFQTMYLAWAPRIYSLGDAGLTWPL